MLKQLQINGANILKTMGKIKIQQFRTNDLVDDNGKQIEFGKTWTESFFKVDSSVDEVILNLTFKAITLDTVDFDGKSIILKLAGVTGRSDRKAYANGNNGRSQLKDFFLSDLGLSVVDNNSDYFALYQVNDRDYFLYYIPNLLYNNFIKFFESSNTEVSVSRTRPESFVGKDAVLPLQQIFYGAPGTGKSHRIDGKTNDDNSIRTTFHPDTDYATFVGAYKPMMEETEVRAIPVVLNNGASFDQNNGTYKEMRIVYKYEPQVFLKAYIEAWKKWLGNDEDKKYFLVIEEINRGNCAQIFGDLFQLLDREDDGFSGYAISPESSITKYLAEEAQSVDGTKFSDLDFSDVIKKREDETETEIGKIIATAADLKAGKRLVLPPNLHIWATMNTSDQSLFPIDSAFKRRWDWKYVPIDYEKEEWSIMAKGVSYSWSDFLKKMNNLVASTTDSEDKMLGFYFAKAKDGIIDADTFVGKVVFYLWNDVFKDYGLPKEILNGAESKEFAFRNFFNVDGSANEDVVKRLLDNLEIKIAGSNENETYIENDDIDAGKAEHKETLVAVTINGERLTADDITQFDLYLNAIKKIGVNRIGPALEAMKYRRKGSPMATKDPVQSLLESDNYSYVKVDGYYFVKGANGYTLVRILEDLNTSLNLNIQIEYR